MITDAAILERACTLAKGARWTIALQRRRLRSAEPEDSKFLFRLSADFQFLILALRRLRRAVELASRVEIAAQPLKRAIDQFDASIPALRTMRDVGEHNDNYSIDNPRRRHRRITRQMLHVEEWDGTTFKWLDQALNIDTAHRAAGARLTALIDEMKRFNPPEGKY